MQATSAGTVSARLAKIPATALKIVRTTPSFVTHVTAAPMAAIRVFVFATVCVSVLATVVATRAKLAGIVRRYAGMGPAKAVKTVAIARRIARMIRHRAPHANATLMAMWLEMVPLECVRVTLVAKVAVIAAKISALYAAIAFRSAHAAPRIIPISRLQAALSRAS